MSAKILILDIETAPAKVWSWGLYDQNIPINMVIEAGHVICWCAKWLDNSKMLSGVYNKNTKACYKAMLQGVWNLMDEADIVVTHNGNSFDIKWLNMVFLENKMPPPSTFRSVDTKVESAKNFYSLSNKLDYIGQKLELGAKLNTGGFDLWKQSMEFNRKALSKMQTYCAQDVLLLEKIYLKLRPYMKNHPNLSLYSHEDFVCTNCESDRLEKKGFAYTANSVYQRYKCRDCGKQMRAKKSILSTKIASA